eukprot:TRINITY_DN11307_c0_g1_i2.p1 TRINITY_DN11307_c0_g1~~TRINITY_DN11307_c0_g1_i2.p1  ORF type:complete len:629 (+),score=75.88 TRINITY_DN11307_c0_g1_i2:97-1983(+)
MQPTRCLFFFILLSSFYSSIFGECVINTGPFGNDISKAFKSATNCNLKVILILSQDIPVPSQSITVVGTSRTNLTITADRFDFFTILFSFQTFGTVELNGLSLTKINSSLEFNSVNRVIITNCRFFDNSHSITTNNVQDITVQGSLFDTISGNSAIDANGGTLTVLNSRFKRCNANEGAAIHGIVTYVNSSAFSFNTAKLGSSIMSNTMHLFNNTFSNDDVTNAGVVWGFQVFANNCTFSNIIGGPYSLGAIIASSKSIIAGCSFSNTTGFNAIYSDSGQITISDSYFANYRGSSVAIRGPSVTSTRNTYLNNYITGTEEGGVFSISRSGYFKGDQFLNNQAVTFGAAIYSTANSFIVEDCTFDSNHANTGGAIWSYQTQVFRSIFANNRAGNGGASYNYFSSNYSDCQFINNLGSDGGAIYSRAQSNINGCEFQYNQASSGGAIYSQAGMNINGSVFSSNLAINRGGGVYSVNSLVQNTKFDANLANFGSDLAALGNTLLQNVLFSHASVYVQKNVMVTGHNFQSSEIDCDDYYEPSIFESSATCISGSSSLRHSTSSINTKSSFFSLRSSPSSPNSLTSPISKILDSSSILGSVTTDIIHVNHSNSLVPIGATLFFCIALSALNFL